MEVSIRRINSVFAGMLQLARLSPSERADATSLEQVKKTWSPTSRQGAKRSDEALQSSKNQVDQLRVRGRMPMLKTQTRSSKTLRSCRVERCLRPAGPTSSRRAH